FDGRQVVPIQGMTMVPFLTGEDTLVHSEDYVYGWEINDFVASRKGDWKLLFDDDVGGAEWHLYNLAMEGGERVDLRDEYPDIFAEMMREYRHFVIRNNIHVNADGLPSNDFDDL